MHKSPVLSFQKLNRSDKCSRAEFFPERQNLHGVSMNRSAELRSIPFVFIHFNQVIYMVIYVMFFLNIEWL